jgi:outer membrane protein assembly factor BamB
MDFNPAGNILVAGFSSNNIVTLDANTGAVVNSFVASGARGVYQLGNGNILWSNSAGVHVYDIGLGSSSQVYAGGGRYLQYAAVPEPATMAILGGGLAVLLRRRRR